MIMGYGPRSYFVLFDKVGNGEECSLVVKILRRRIGDDVLNEKTPSDVKTTQRRTIKQEAGCKEIRGVRSVVWKRRSLTPRSSEVSFK